MSASADYHVLVLHPANLAPMIRAVEAGVIALADGNIVFRYRLQGDMARVRLPEADAPERRDRLWEHTCFEAFVGVESSTAYREFNFSPSGRWAAYDFADYRRRAADPVLAAPRITARATEGRLELQAGLSFSSLPSVPPGKSWLIGLSAVVEAVNTIDDALSCWALRHPAPRPDFHLRDGFALRYP
jgi:hypothetical protein